MGDCPLVGVLKEYTGYFDQARPHHGLAQQTPESGWRGQANGTVRQSAAVSAASLAPGQGVGRKLIARPVLNGLHHASTWAT
jgi:hypothetical protein